MPKTLKWQGLSTIFISNKCPELHQTAWSVDQFTSAWPPAWCASAELPRIIHEQWLTTRSRLLDKNPNLIAKNIQFKSSEAATASFRRNKKRERVGERKYNHTEIDTWARLANNADLLPSLNVQCYTFDDWGVWVAVPHLVMFECDSSFTRPRCWWDLGVVDYGPLNIESLRQSKKKHVSSSHHPGHGS